MKICITLLSVLLLLAACGKQDDPPQIAKPQRDALEKAKGVEDGIQKAAEAMRKKTEEAGQ